MASQVELSTDEQKQLQGMCIKEQAKDVGERGRKSC